MVQIKRDARWEMREEGGAAEKRQTLKKVTNLSIYIDGARHLFPGQNAEQEFKT